MTNEVSPFYLWFILSIPIIYSFDIYYERSKNETDKSEMKYLINLLIYFSVIGNKI